MRNKKVITITAEGRDKNKVFVISEMTASRAEEWAMRAREAISKNCEVPANLSTSGMLGVFILGLKPLLSAPFDMLKPLLDEMFAQCLSYMPNPADPSVLRGIGTYNIDGVKSIGAMMEEDIEEVATRVLLRDAIFELHTGFSIAAAISKAWEQVVAAAKESDLLARQMSQMQSASPSAETQH